MSTNQRETSAADKAVQAFMEWTREAGYAVAVIDPEVVGDESPDVVSYQMMARGKEIVQGDYSAHQHGRPTNSIGLADEDKDTLCSALEEAIDESNYRLERDAKDPNPVYTQDDRERMELENTKRQTLVHILKGDRKHG